MNLPTFQQTAHHVLLASRHEAATKYQIGLQSQHLAEVFQSSTSQKKTSPNFNKPLLFGGALSSFLHPTWFEKRKTSPKPKRNKRWRDLTFRKGSQASPEAARPLGRPTPIVSPFPKHCCWLRRTPPWLPGDAQSIGLVKWSTLISLSFFCCFVVVGCCWLLLLVVG